MTKSFTQRKALDSKLNILVLKPFLKFERLGDESTLSASIYRGDAIETNLTIAAIHEVELRHLIPIDSRNQSNNTLLAVCNQLQSLSPQLSSGQISNQTHSLLKLLDTLIGHHAILVQYLKVKVGPDASRTIYTFSGTSSHFQATLISCVTGEVLWNNEVLLRDLPKVNNSNFTESIKLLFKSFPNGTE
jgi:hypothetical protein